jgi:mitogen-activated protein kinase kinase
VWSLGITLIEIALGRFPFSSDDDVSSSDDDADAALARLSLRVDDADDETRDLFADDLDDTLSPARPEKKRESIMLAEERRASKRDSLRSGGSMPRAKGRKTAPGVSLAGSGHQMSILELLQHIVNEPAPRLPPGRFSSAAEDFVNATLRKEPVGWNVKKKGPLPKDAARPTPKELLVSCGSVGQALFKNCR